MLKFATKGSYFCNPTSVQFLKRSTVTVFIAAVFYTIICKWALFSPLTGEAFAFNCFNIPIRVWYFLKIDSLIVVRLCQVKICNERQLFLQTNIGTVVRVAVFLVLHSCSFYSGRFSINCFS